MSPLARGRGPELRTRMSPAIGEHAVLHTIPSLERTIRELRAEVHEERQARQRAERQVAELRSRIRHLDVCGVTTSDDGGIW